MTDSATLKTLERVCIDIARQAADKILQVYETAFTVDEKHDNSPVTAADVAAHEIIATQLGQIAPHWPVLSEEGTVLSYDERKSWSSYWLVDPLDGTREFVKRNGEFTVNIALIENNVPVLGVVLAPVLNSLYYSSVGNGAFKQLAEAESQSIQVRSSNHDVLVVAGSRSHFNNDFSAYLQNIGSHQLLNIGSSLKICMVAEGEADLYPRFGPTSEWDTAAAQCILEQAGGQLTDTAMQPLRYNCKESLLNPSFFAFGDNSRDWSSYL